MRIDIVPEPSGLREHVEAMGVVRTEPEPVRASSLFGVAAPSIARCSWCDRPNSTANSFGATTRDADCSRSSRPRGRGTHRSRSLSASTIASLMLSFSWNSAKSSPEQRGADRVGGTLAGTDRPLVERESR